MEGYVMSGRADRPDLQMITSYEVTDPRLDETEAVALHRVLRAIEQAIEHPKVSIDWRVSLQSAHSALLDFLEPPVSGPLELAAPVLE